MEPGRLDQHPTFAQHSCGSANFAFVDEHIYALTPWRTQVACLLFNYLPQASLYESSGVQADRSGTIGIFACL